MNRTRTWSTVLAGALLAAACAPGTGVWLRADDACIEPGQTLTAEAGGLEEDLEHVAQLVPATGEDAPVEPFTAASDADGRLEVAMDLPSDASPLGDYELEVDDAAGELPDTYAVSVDLELAEDCGP